MLRATGPGDGRRNDLTSYSGAQTGWLLRGRAQASYAAAGQPRGKLREALKRWFARVFKTLTLMVITIVVYLATVRQWLYM